MDRLILLLGINGCGKGTIGKMLANAGYGEYFSTGDWVRSLLATGHTKGLEGVNQGNMAGNDLINPKVRTKLSDINPGGLVLDGYIRDIEQAGLFLGMNEEFGLSEGLTVFNFVGVSDELAFHRCFNRKDRREDDTRESILTRIGIFHERVEPAIEVLRKGLSPEQFFDIDGSGTPRQVFKETISFLPVSVE